MWFFKLLVFSAHPSRQVQGKAERRSIHMHTMARRLRWHKKYGNQTHSTSLPTRHSILSLHLSTRRKKNDSVHLFICICLLVSTERILLYEVNLDIQQLLNFCIDKRIIVFLKLRLIWTVRGKKISNFVLKNYSVILWRSPTNGQSG